MAPPFGLVVVSLTRRRRASSPRTQGVLMRFASPSHSTLGDRVRFALLVSGADVVRPGRGCEDKHIGRPCELGTMPTRRVAAAQVATSRRPRSSARAASACCRAPQTAIRENTGPLCTASCEANETATDGETGRRTIPTIASCENGFVCMWPTTVGNFACQQLCVCRDFVVEPPGGFRSRPSAPDRARRSRLTARALTARPRSEPSLCLDRASPRAPAPV